MNLLPDWIPNVHPMVVHFPIASILIAFLFDLAATILKKQNWLRYSAFGLYAISALGAIAAFLSGRQAADVVDIPPAAYPVISEHADLALVTMIVLISYAIIKFVLLWKKWDLKTPVAVLLLVAGSVGIALIAKTAEHGAELVYRYGVGVAATESSEHSKSVIAPQDFSEISIFKNRSWKWVSGPEIPDVIRNKLKLLEGSWEKFHLKYISGESSALMIQIPQRESLLFIAGQPIDDVQVMIEINLDKFNGRFSLVHHVQDKDNYDLFDKGIGQIRLGRVEQGKLVVFDESAMKVENWFTLKTVGTKGHFRGYVNDKLVTHGHAKDLLAGSVGFALQGKGIILIKTMETISLDKNDHEGSELNE
jgi:uncharacterized membrane protein